MCRRLAILMLLVAPLPAWAQINAGTVWEIRTTGSYLNGGGYFTTAGSTDYSQQDAAQVSLTDLACAEAAATTLTSATGGFTDAMEGNVIYIASGSNFTPGWYQVTGYTNANTVTIDRDPTDGDGGDGSGGNGKLGGAIALGNAAIDSEFSAALVASNTVYLKAGTYAISENVAAGTAGTATTPIKWIGYSSARDDAPRGANAPLLDFVGGSDFTGAYATYHVFHNIRFRNRSATGISMGVANVCESCGFLNDSTTANRVAVTTVSGGCHFYDCDIACYKGRGVSNSGTCELYKCIIHDSSTGVFAGGSFTASNCLVFGCTTAGLDVNNRNASLIFDCTILGCGIGISGTNATGVCIVDNIILYNTTGINWTTPTPANLQDYNILYGNGANLGAGMSLGAHDISDADPGITGLVAAANGATNAGDQTLFSSASAPFAGVTTADRLIVLSGTGATAGTYAITGVTDSSNIVVGTGIGAGASNVVFRILKGYDATLSSGSSNALDAALGIGNGGMTGSYKMNIGVDQNDNAAGGGRSAGANLDGELQ